MPTFYKRSPQKTMCFMPVIHYKAISTSQRVDIEGIYIYYIVIRNKTYSFKRAMFSLFETSYIVL